MTISRKIVPRGLSRVHCVAKWTLRKTTSESILREFISPVSLCMIAAFVTRDLMAKIVFLFTCPNSTTMLNKHVWKESEVLFHPYMILTLGPTTTFDEYMGRSLETGMIECKLCGKTNKSKQNIKNHIEGVHFRGQFVYECTYCKKTFNGKNSLSVHLSKFHSNAQY